MIRLEPCAEGVVVAVRAQANGRKNGIVGEHDGALRIMVTKAPEKGRANSAIQNVLAAALGLKRSQCQLIQGPTSNQKKFLVRGIRLDELRDRIDRCLGG